MTYKIIKMESGQESFGPRKDQLYYKISAELQIGEIYLYAQWRQFLKPTFTVGDDVFIEDVIESHGLEKTA